MDKFQGLVLDLENSYSNSKPLESNTRDRGKILIFPERTGNTVNKYCCDGFHSSPQKLSVSPVLSVIYIVFWVDGRTVVFQLKQEHR